MALFFECMQSCAQIVLDSADIVGDGDVTKADGPLSIISMDNSQNHPDEKSKRGHTERDEIVS